MLCSWDDDDCNDGDDDCFYSVLESLGKLSKLIIPFSRTWKVLEKRVFKMAVDKFWIFVWKNSRNILKSMLLSFVLSTVFVIYVHFAIYNVKHDPPKYFFENNVFIILWGFQNANENVLHGFGNLVIWRWKSFGNIFEGVCANPG